MRVPERLEPLLDYGVIQDVIRPLQSGKEAEVFLVIKDDAECVAKVYKNSEFRSFQSRAQYTEGRRVRSSREQRAMNKSSRHGRAKTEEAWQSAEVDAIGRLRAAGVRVPEPYAFAEGVLVMELVRGVDGTPAPRLADVHFSPDEAEEIFHFLIREVVKMLCAGIVHADLSDFNILISHDGPVIIDFPQAVDPAANQSAQKLLKRDVKNVTSFLGRFAPHLRRTQYGPEMWDLYERSQLFPDTELTGKYVSRKPKAKVNDLLAEIMEIEQEARERREELGLPPPKPARRPVVFVEVEEEAPRPAGDRPGGKGRRRRGGRGRDKPQGAGDPRAGAPQTAKPPGPSQPGPSEGEGGEAKPKRRRRRRRGRSGGAPAGDGPANPGQQAQAPKPKPQAAAPSGEGGDKPKRRRRRRRRGKPGPKPE